MRACPTCHISGPVSLCRSDIREHFGQQVQSCQVRDNCRNGVDSYAQLPRLVVRFLNTSAHRVDWSTEMERLLLAAAEAGKDISPTAYPHAARYLRDALARYPVRAKSVLVGGSITPWVEATLAVAGAGSIQTSDYQERIVDSNITRFIHVGSIEEGSFDAVVSYSSIEHDGLGRYCDPVNPNGDLSSTTGSSLEATCSSACPLGRGSPTGSSVGIATASMARSASSKTSRVASSCSTLAQT